MSVMILTNGLIKQWGDTVTVTGSTDYRYFPIAWSSKNSYIALAAYQGRGANGGCGCIKISGSQYLPYSANTNGNFVNDGISWFAIGF